MKGNHKPFITVQDLNTFHTLYQDVCHKNKSFCSLGLTCQSYDIEELITHNIQIVNQDSVGLKSLTYKLSVTQPVLYMLSPEITDESFTKPRHILSSTAITVLFPSYAFVPDLCNVQNHLINKKTQIHEIVSKCHQDCVGFPHVT